MEMQEMLVWVMGGGGAGIVAYWLMGHIAFLMQLAPEWKRYASLALAACLAMLAYAAAVGLGYEAQPESSQAWLEALFSVAAVAIGLSQAIHGRVKLRR